MMGAPRRSILAVATYVMILVFGVYTTVFPLVAVRQNTFPWAATLLGAEFTIAATLLIFGSARRPIIRIAGLVVVCIGLATISLIILTRGEPESLGSAFLFGAFALEAVHDIKEEREYRKRLSQEENKLLRDLNELLREGNGQ